jgi:Tfp pilus assembly protein PilV
MLVAMVLLGLVGLALARFQTFQLANTASLATAAAARLEADNQAVDVLVAPAAPVSDSSGTSVSAGRTLHWSHSVDPSPDPALMPDLVSVEIRVALTPDGAPLATRSVLRPRGPAGLPAA